MDFVAIFKAAFDIRYAYNPPWALSSMEPSTELIFTIDARLTPKDFSLLTFDAFFSNGINAYGIEIRDETQKKKSELILGEFN